MALSVGDKAPNFTLPSTLGRDYTLNINHIGRPLVLYFYPADFTPGCTTEACGYRDTFEMFKSYDIDIIGISKDTIESHLKFKQEYNLPFELLSDPNLEVSKLYDTIVPFINFTKRTTYLLDRKHNVAAVYQNIFVAQKHIDEMVKQVKSGKINYENSPKV